MDFRLLLSPSSCEVHSQARPGHSLRPSLLKLALSLRRLVFVMLGAMDPLHATLEEFAVEGYTHIARFCPLASSQPNARRL
jgi:hypothetical protein